MNRAPSSAPRRATMFVETLEPRIAPAGLLNESKFTSVVVGGSVLLDASGGTNDYQGLSTAFGTNAGSYLLYITTGKALVFTTDLNGNGRLDPGEITGISAGVDSLGRPLNLILFSDVNGDIATNLLPGHGVSELTDSDNNPNNGRDGKILLDNAIGSITIRALTAADINTTIAGNTVANRLALTSFSIYGNIYAGGGFGGLTIDTSGSGLLASKFNGTTGVELFTAATPQVEGIYTGTAADYQSFHFTQNAPFTTTAGVNLGNNTEGTFIPFVPPVGEHGGDIANIAAADSTTVFSIGTLHTGDGGFGARGGNISGVVYNGDTGSYTIITGDGGQGATGGAGGSLILFNDLGTITGQATIHTGVGGEGLLGAGGAGGTATFTTTNIAAEVSLFLGNGGAGFNAGGGGAGLTGASFTTPEGGVPVGTSFIGTWHNTGDLGVTKPATMTTSNGTTTYTYGPDTIDWDGDGAGDGVYVGTNPDQIVVVFGDGTGGIDAAKTVYLDVPGVVNPVVTVGDFNGDGRPDIAVASGSATNSGGIYVFLNQTHDAIHNPLGVGQFTANPDGDHPFSAALESALPSLTSFGELQGPGAVLALAAGDFNGDGITDIAYVQRVVPIGAATTTARVVGILFGDAVVDPNTSQALTYTSGLTPGHIEGSGYFYANSANPGKAETLQVASFTDSAMASAVLHATSLNADNVAIGSTTGMPSAPEVVFYGGVGDTTLAELALGNTNTAHKPGVAGLNATFFLLGTVDTNRILSTAASVQVSLQPATLQDFTLQDLDSDGQVDIVALTKTPETFAVTFTQANGAFAVGSNDPMSPTTGPAAGDNSGYFLGLLPATTIVSVDSNTDGHFTEVAILLQYLDTPIQEFDFTGTNTNGGAATLLNAYGTIIQSPDQINPGGFDSFYPIAASAADTSPTPGYGLLGQNTTSYLTADLYTFIGAGSPKPNLVSLPTGEIYETNNGFYIHAGDGGASTTGPGGAGGAIGTGALSGGVNGQAVGSVSVVFPAYQAYQGAALFQGGDGGSGFAGGGIGGDLSGISVRYSPTAAVLTSQATLLTGNGGNGISGDGGRGGNLNNDSVEAGTDGVFQTGNGGSGLHGGNGGSILGNTGGFYDDSGLSSTATTGFGGQGALGGGTGGSITNFDSQFLPAIGGIGGALAYTTGSGGTAAAGGGGNGGAITNSSPNSAVNNLSGNLTLISGAGGSGLSGGTGGAISNFVNSPTSDTAVATELLIISGSGGVGVVSAGGTGGAISNISTNASGLISIDGQDFFGVGRVVSGSGGASYGGAGGAGGLINNITVETTSTPIAVAAGNGGDGVTLGGLGGSVTNSIIDSAAQQIGKVLIIAGAGGDVVGALPSDIFINGDTNLNDLAHAALAFGGESGIGGNGGSVENVSQPVSTQTAVDIIAGNGGSTLNYGTAVSSVTGVGQGGSISNITLAGTAGAITRNTTFGTVTNPPIQSYTLTDNGSGAVANLSAAQLAVFLDDANANIGALGDGTPASLAGGFDYSLGGNVGIVAGIAGKVKGDAAQPGGLPARDGINGSVVTLSASSIMSIVAGSVDSVAPVQVLSGLTVTNPDGVLGADKSPTAPYGPNGVRDYIDENGNATNTLLPGYKLVDGAIFATTIEQPASPPFITGPRVFSPSTT